MAESHFHKAPFLLVAAVDTSLDLRTPAGDTCRWPGLRLGSRAFLPTGSVKHRDGCLCSFCTKVWHPEAKPAKPAKPAKQGKYGREARLLGLARTHSEESRQLELAIAVSKAEDEARAAKRKHPR